MDEPTAQSRPSAHRAGPAPATGMALIGLAAALLAALILPLGASEAAGLAWLNGAAAPELGWGSPFVHLIAQLRSADQPAVALTLAAILFKLVPALGALLALRLPDILAAGVVAACLVRSGWTSAVGVLAALIFLVSPALWTVVVGPPGLIVDAAAALLLYRLTCSARPDLHFFALTAVLAAIVALIANSAGVYAIAILGGVYLHHGLSRGEWRLFGSIRLTLLGALVLAGLTLVDVLGLPAVAPWAGLRHTLIMANERSGFAVSLRGLAAIAALPSLLALFWSIRRTGDAPGRLVLILVVGAIVLSTAETAPPLAVVTLAPIVALWWAAPLARIGRRMGASWIAGLYVLCCLAAAAALLIFGRGEPTSVAWAPPASMAAAGLFAFLALILLWRAGHRVKAAPAIPVSLALLAVAVASALWLAAPQQVLPQRSYDRELADALQPLAQRPIATLASVDTPLWRAELGRPLFTAKDLAVLCHWAGRHPGHAAPIVLARPGATDSILKRFKHARPLLQSAGTPRTSVMVIELGEPAGC